MKSQNEKIRRHLTMGRKITPLQALKMYGCFRLSARIHDLKQKGLRIVSKIVTTKTGKHVAQYSLKGK